MYRGRYGERLVFEVHADDGRTYVVTLEPDDVAVVVGAAKARPKERKRGVSTAATGERAGAEAVR